MVQVRLNALQLQRPRQWGACWLALELWAQLRLDDFWSQHLKPSRQGTRWLQVLKTLVCYRLIDPGSEWRLHRQWFEQSAMADLLGEDFALGQKDKLYRCLDRLLPHKQTFFSYLKQRWKTLFNPRFDILLYDLTGTYFESDPPGIGKRRYGYSRDKRPDCVQVVIALIVTPEGFPFVTDISAGCGALVLGPGESTVCTFTADHTGNPGDTFANTVTVTATDGRGAWVGGSSNTVTVSISVVLAPGVPDPGAYGSSYGSNRNEVSLAVGFENIGMDTELSVTGWDIDFADEVAVSLNGYLLGHLSIGPDNGLNGGDTFLIPASQQLPGTTSSSFIRIIAGRCGAYRICCYHPRKPWYSSPTSPILAPTAMVLAAVNMQHR